MSGNHAQAGGQIGSSGAENFLRNLVYRHLAALRLAQNWRSNLETGHKFVVTERQVESMSDIDEPSMLLPKLPT
jgi:hypothetical protein